MKDKMILVVEDDADLAAVYAVHLQGMGYETRIAGNGREAIALLAAQPDTFGMVLADIVMPEMDGYALCHALKESETLRPIPLMFVSSLTTLEEKLKGYAVGADDYIAKPIAAEELALKVGVLMDMYGRAKELNERLAESNRVAMQAMTYSADLGQILEFYKNALGAADFRQLADHLFAVTSGYGLHCTLQIIGRGEVINFSDVGEVSPLESNVIEMSRSRGRFFDFGARTIINYADFSILIKNMPKDDPERYGIFKDTLGTLCNAIEARVKFMLHENTSRHKDRIVATVRHALAEIDQNLRDIQQANLSAIENMMNRLDASMMHLGLSGEQEDEIRDIVQECRNTIECEFERGLQLNGKVGTVTRQLTGLLGGV